MHKRSSLYYCIVMNWIGLDRYRALVNNITDSGSGDREHRSVDDTVSTVSLSFSVVGFFFASPRWC